MSNRPTVVKENRDKAKLAFDTWDIMLGLQESFNEELIAPPASMKDEECVLTVPLSAHIFKDSFICMNVDILDCAEELKLRLIDEPVEIELTLTGYLKMSGDLINYEILNEDGHIKVYKNCDWTDTGMYIPIQILSRLAQEIGPKIHKDELTTSGDYGQLCGYFNFKWPVYFCIPFTDEEHLMKLLSRDDFDEEYVKIVLEGDVSLENLLKIKESTQDQLVKENVEMVISAVSK